MKNKSIITDILIIIIALLLVILKGTKNYLEDASAVSTVFPAFDIYLITIDKTDQYWDKLDQGAADMAEMLGVTYRWEAPQKKNTREQIAILEKAVEEGADAILIAVNDPIATSREIEDAKARSVKIIYVDTPAYEEAITTFSTENTHAGIVAGDAMLYELNELGIQSGSIGIIGVNKVTDSTLKREAGFTEVIQADGRFTLIPTSYQNGDADASLAAAAAFIRDNTDIVGLFGTNEGSTIGVGNAIRINNANIIGIGFDQSDATMELIRDGSLKAIIVQNPYSMGYFGMAQAVAALRGLPAGASQVDIGVTVLTKR